MKRSYFCLPREIRQQILFECFALADQEDTDDLVTLGKCFSKEHEVRVKLCQELRPDASVLTAGDLKSRDKKRQEPLWYCPAAEQLLRYLSGVNNAMRRDAKFVVNKWADSKKGPNITLVAKLFEEDVLDSGLMKLACGMSFAASFNALLQNLTEVYLASMSS